ncbi:MAG: aldo/keto reductase [Proteobacteria bacterium]|nr:aldo/keto reductase [Pseudomonadota bacterium]
MEYVNLGGSGLRVSQLCLGTMTFGDKAWRDWMLDEEQARPIVRAAAEAGINFFDTADMYSQGASERITGRLVAELGGRDEYVLATKVNTPMGPAPTQRGLSRKHIMEGIDASLDRLGQDYVDLYIIHRWDDTTPIEETMEALHDVVKAGKALYLGASSMYAWQFAKAQAVARRHGWTPFIAMQNHYNLIYREEEREMIPACMDMGVAVTPWSPLARGFLAGNRHRQGGGDTLRARGDDMAQSAYYSEVDFEIADRVAQIANEHGVKPIQVALAWILAKPGVVSPVIGVSSTAQLNELTAELSATLSDEEMERLETPYIPKLIAGHG